MFALRYLADETYRRRIGRQLDKGESLHSLSRELVFANDGAARRQAMCLTLAVNAITGLRDNGDLELGGRCTERVGRDGEHQPA